MKITEATNLIINNIEARYEGLIDGVLKVGFESGATYDDGTSVAEVAFKNEYGGRWYVPYAGREMNVPARPFFRSMIAKEKPDLLNNFIKALATTKLDSQQALGMIGLHLEGALSQSIRDTSEPPNSPVTIAYKGFNDPLVKTGHMMRSVSSRVDND
jgi:hypothetical protein